MDQDILPQLLLDQDKDLIWAVDLQLHLVYANTSFSNYFKERKHTEPPKGMDFLASIPEAEVRDHWMELYHRGVAGETFTIKGGLPFDPLATQAMHQITFNPLKDATGTTIAISCKALKTDTEEEQKLKLFEKAINNTTDAIIITEAEPLDEPGPVIVFVNEAFTRMTGYTLEEVKGKNPRLLQGPNSNQTELKELGEKLKRWESAEITVLNYTKWGEEFWVNFIVNPIANAYGWFTHWISVQRDVTEQVQKELEKSLLADLSICFQSEEDLVQVASSICDTIRRFGSFEVTELWVPNMEGTEVHLLANRFSREGASEKYSVSSFLLGEGLPGMVWERDQQIWWSVPEMSDYIVRKNLVRDFDLKVITGIPLKHGNQLTGILLIGCSRPLQSLTKYESVLTRLQQFLGSEMHRKRLESDLRHLYDAIPDILCVFDEKGRIVKMNKGGCDLLDLPLEKVVNQNLNRFLPPEDKTLLFETLEHLPLTAHQFQCETRYLRKTGEVQWLSWNGFYDRQEHLIYASAKNITQEKRLKSLNKQASELAKIGAWELYLPDNRVYWSEMTHLIHETDPTTFEPQWEEALSFYRLDYRKIVADKMEQAVMTGESFDLEAVLLTRQLKEKWVRVLGSAESTDSESIRIYGSIQDISDARETELRLLSLANNLPGIIFQYVIYPDGTDGVRYVSRGAEKVWGYTAEEVMNDVSIVWDGVAAAGYIESLSKSVEDSVKNRTNWKTQWNYITPAKELKTLLGYGTPQFMVDGTVVFDSVILDVTEEAKNEELLHQVSAMARVGSWELDLMHSDSESMYWSPMTRKILECGDDYNPTLTGGFEFYTESSKKVVQQAVALLIEQGIEFDEELLLVTSKGNERWVRCIGKSVRIQDICLKIYGSIQDIHSSKSLELQIREILGSISDAFYSVDAKWNFLYFNKEAERLMNKKEVEVLGKSMWEVFPESKGTSLQTRYEEVMNTNESASFEYFYPGDRNWYEVNAYPSKGGLSVYFKNINERKEAASRLQSALEEKESILESIGDAFITLKTDWTVTYWNSKAEVFLGVSREEAIGKNVWEVFPDAKESNFYKQYAYAMATGEVVRFEEKYESLEKWFEVSAYPSKEGISIYFTDTTQRKEAKEQLELANERFEKVSEATNDAIWDWDILSDEVSLSDSMDNFFGEVVPKEISGKVFWAEGFHPDDLITVQQSIQRALHDPLCERWEMEYRLVNARNDVVYVLDRGLIVRNEEGQAIRMVGAMTDMSERIKLELELKDLTKSLRSYARELERSNEELEQFAFITSHDLQEPLRMISSFMDQLRRKYGDQLDDKALQYIHFATDGAKRMKQIILDLLEFSRANRPTEDIQEVDLNEVLFDFKLLRRKVLSDTSATITSQDLPKLHTYKTVVTQIFHGLLDNAVKYSKPGVPPEVQVSVVEKDREWEFLVKDNGIGIEPEFFEKIFVIFQRLHNRDAYPGTGIGLSIVKRSVEFLNGKIWLTSEPGEGSVFYFTIPKSNSLNE